MRYIENATKIYSTPNPSPGELPIGYYDPETDLIADSEDFWVTVVWTCVDDETQTYESELILILPQFDIDHIGMRMENLPNNWVTPQLALCPTPFD